MAAYTILAVFDLQLNLIIPTKFRVNWGFSVQEQKLKIDFQVAAKEVGFQIGSIYASHLDTFYLVSSQQVFQVRR